MSVYIDADAIITWERGDFDLPAWLEAKGDEAFGIPATVWQQVQFGIFGWGRGRSDKRARSLAAIKNLPVVSLTGLHAETAARLQAQLKENSIGFADFQIAATALSDGAELLSFNEAHFGRVPGLRLAKLRK